MSESERMGKAVKEPEAIIDDMDAMMNRVF